MLLRLAVPVLVAAPMLLAPPAAQAQGAPVFHGVLSVRRAGGGFDKTVGTASLRVRNWTLRLDLGSDGIAPEREPIIIAVGDSERLVIPAGQMRQSRNGKRYSYRNPGIPRGVRRLDIRRLNPDGSGVERYRVGFVLAGIDLSALMLQFPICTPLAVIVGDDDGFSGVELDRPGGFKGSRVRVLGACTDVDDWPWV